MAREALQPGGLVPLVCSVSLHLAHVRLPGRRERFLIHIAKLTSRKVTAVYTSHCCVYGLSVHTAHIKPVTSWFYDLE